MQKLEDMNLIDNFLFQEVARNKEYGGEFCRIILETILGREIKEVEIDVEVEKSIPGATLESHGIRLDALVKERDPHRMEVSTGSGAATYFDLEPNNYKISDPARRGRYYQAVVTSEHFGKGLDYKYLMDTYVIFILSDDPFGEDRMMYTIRNGCVELPDMPYEDRQITIFLYTKGKYAPSQELSDMLKYIENSREENVSNPSLQRMSDMVRETKRDRTVGAKFMMWWDYEADMKRHAREEGLEEGRKDGLREGISILIDTFREDGKTRDETAARIRDKFALSEEEAAHYMDQFWIK